MNCPYCQFPSCYESGFRVECANPKCRYYTLEQCIVYVDAEIRRRLCLVVSKDWDGVVDPFPPGFQLHNPEPGVVALTWTGPDTGELTRYYNLSKPKVCGSCGQQIKKEN